MERRSPSLARSLKSLARSGVAAVALATAFAGSALAQPAPVTPAIGVVPAAAANTPVLIGFADLADDPRRDPERIYYMIPVRPWGRSVDGFRLALQDAAPIGSVIHVDFTARETSAASVDELIATVRGWVSEGLHFAVVDLSANDLLTVSDAVADLPITLFNAGAYEDRLRGADCRYNVVHTIPSYRMLTDAMVQYLVSRRWQSILVLQGPSDADADTVEALRASAGFFGARIAEVRPFILSNDPMNREVSNVRLLTTGTNFDVIYVADADGEFARFVEYDTGAPRPVVGSAGLVATAWSWNYQRQGSAEVNIRFDDIAGRHMTDIDWAAWVSVKAVVQSVLRSQSTEYQAALDYLLGDRMNLDPAKGNPMSVRSWDHQFRQSIDFNSGNAVMDEAPIAGFIHPTNDLDTLGVDQGQSTCRF